jgi:hypothetical protein
MYSPLIKLTCPKVAFVAVSIEKYSGVDKEVLLVHRLMSEMPGQLRDSLNDRRRSERERFTIGQNL